MSRWVEITDKRYGCHTCLKYVMWLNNKNQVTINAAEYAAFDISEFEEYLTPTLSLKSERYSGYRRKERIVCRYSLEGEQGSLGAICHR